MRMLNDQESTYYLHQIKQKSEEKLAKIYYVYGLKM